MEFGSGRASALHFVQRDFLGRSYLVGGRGSPLGAAELVLESGSPADDPDEEDSYAGGADSEQQLLHGFRADGG